MIVKYSEYTPSKLFKMDFYSLRALARELNVKNCNRLRRVELIEEITDQLQLLSSLAHYFGKKKRFILITEDLQWKKFARYH